MKASSQAQSSNRTNTEAFKWFSAAAEQGSPEAQSNVVVMYLQGSGRPMDARAAVAWLTRAAVQDLPGAQRMLAEAYASGNGVGKDDAAAVTWFQRAASVGCFRQAAGLGNAVAMGYLGDMYFRVFGTGQRDREAVRWYLTSAAAGFANCQPNLKARDADRRSLVDDRARRSACSSSEPPRFLGRPRRFSRHGTPRAEKRLRQARMTKIMRSTGGLLVGAGGRLLWGTD